MSTLKKFGILTALTLLCTPFLRIQSRLDVAVNWSIQEEAPKGHTVTIQDLSFTVPAGQSVKQPIRLKGGGSAAVVYAIRSWGFIGQQIKVDGKEVPLHRIKTANKRGALRVFGIGRAAAMDARIMM